MRFILLLLLFFSQSLVNAQVNSQDDNSAVWQYYREHVQDSVDGKSIGSVSNGRLDNGTLLPFSGENFRYFDSASYLNGRAFLFQPVARTILNTYNTFLDKGSDRQFRYMECSNEHGGKLFPHRTHQNGMSVDLMTPLIKKKRAYYGLDDSGIAHYGLNFDDQGHYTEDGSISIDFETLAEHILILDKAARDQGLRIQKVIFKMELKDELYSTESGKKLKTSGIYITKNLTPLINSLHDDHFHVDFVKL